MMRFDRRVALVGIIAVLAVAGRAWSDEVIEKRVTVEQQQYKVETVPVPPAAVIEKRTTVETVPAAPVVEERTTVRTVPAPAVIEKRTTVETAPGAPAVIERRTETVIEDD